MKKNLLLLALLIFSLSTFSQTFNYFENRPMWREDFSTRDGENCIKYDDYVLYIQKDTIIDGLKYFTLRRRGYYKQHPKLPPNGVSCEFDDYNYDKVDGFIRQEGFKIYYLQVDLPIENLVYDFGIEVGDTAKGFYMSGSFVVDSIAIEKIGSGNRKLFYSETYLMLTEGMGGSYGLLSPIYDGFETFHKISCFLENDSIIWVNPKTSECDLTVKINKNKDQFNVITFPNPTQNKLFLENFKEAQSIQTLTLNTIDGKQLLPQFTTNQNKVVIDLANLKTGIYFLEISSLDGKRYYSKFVKE